MDRYKIGDEVKVIGGTVGVGCQATVTSQTYWTRDIGGELAYRYNVDINGFGREGAKGIPYAKKENQLAPIYDGWDKCEWEDCYWTPYVTVDK